VSRILRLAMLAPDLVEAILAGSSNQGMVLEQLERPLPASWQGQRDVISAIVIEHNGYAHRAAAPE